MSKNVVVNGTTYNGVDSVKLPLVGGGYATFADAESGTSQTVELYSKTINSAESLVAIQAESSWSGYAVIFLLISGLTLSASDYIRVGYDNTNTSGRQGFYPAASKVTTYTDTNPSVLFVKFNNSFYRPSIEPNTTRIEPYTPGTINVFPTTSGVTFTGGTIKIYGVK